jgi:hypothetical protein
MAKDHVVRWRAANHAHCSSSQTPRSHIYEGFRLFLRCCSSLLLFVVTICLAVPAPALAHGEEAAAYPAGVLSSLPLVLLAMLISRPGWGWSAIIFLLALLSAFVAGVVPMDFLPSWLAHSANGAFATGFVPPIAATAILLLGIRKYRRASR